MARPPRDPYPDNGFLRDFSGQIVGQVQRPGDGSEWIFRFPGAEPAGRYDPTMNVTFDFAGNIVGFGNLLTSLLAKR